MNLYIMSRGRAGKVTTLASIPPSWRDRTYLVVPDYQVEAYDSYYKPVATTIAAPSHVDDYSKKFQWILLGLPFTPPPTRATGYIDSVPGHLWERNEKAVILDDDLVFSKKNEEGKLITVRDPEQLAPMFEQMEVLLDSFPLVGIHPRAMGQNAPTPYVKNGRIICVQGINRQLIGPVQVDQFPIMADVILNLTLLGRGDESALLTTFFQDHGPCQAPGGCSIYRTPAMQEQVVDWLCDRWPGFVKKVIRRPKVAKWMGDTRVEYTAQWKKLQKAAPDKGKT